MDKIEKIRKYIEERLVYYPTIYTQAGRELVDLRNFLDTLPEQQDVDLEKEIEQVVEKYNRLAKGDKVMKPSGVEKIARHFYELGKNSK